MPSAPPRSHPAYALLAYAAPLAEGRRVVVVGDASFEFGALLVEAGARVVHVYDPAPKGPLRAAPRGVVVRELPQGAFDVRDGAFDLAIVPDLAAVRDAPALLSRLRRLLGSDGALLVAAKNPGASRDGGIEYAELFDMVALQFEHVRMIAQVPFTGVALAELGDENDDPEVSVDMQLGPEDKTPHVFVALAGQRDVHLAPYALVELPPAPAAPRAQASSAEDAALRAALAEATLKAELLTAQLDQTRAAAQRRLAELEAEIARQARRAVELEEQAVDYRRMHALADVELTASRAGIADLEERIAVLEAELETVRAVGDVPQVDPEAVARLAERAERGDRAVAVLQRLEAELAGVAEHHAAELHQLEDRLRDRAKAIANLEAELTRRERLVKELVRTLEERGEGHASAQAAQPDDVARENQSLRERLDALAMDAARREADAQAQAWRITELEEKLAMHGAAPQSPAADAPSADLERLLAQTKGELDVLRQALAQEHEARSRAESGEMLAKAQAELARQATLIEQLSRELDARDRTMTSSSVIDTAT
jgi:hypothetical protein